MHDHTRPVRSDVRGWFAPPPRASYAAGWALLPLRAFLGFTFCFAGLQKLANPAFFDASNPASIQSQLAGAMRTSPLHGLVAHLVHVAVPLGVVIALGELAVGVGTLVGLWTPVAACGGALIALMLFLTVSFHSSPYYTGADIVFFFAWWPLILAGSGGVLSADALLSYRARTKMGAEPSLLVPVPFATIRRVCGSYDQGRCRARQGDACEPAPCPYLAESPAVAPRLSEQEVDRRTFALKGAFTAALAAVALGAAGAAAGLGRLAGGPSKEQVTPRLGKGSSSGSSGSSSATAGGAGSNPASGTAIGSAGQVPVGGAASFEDPGTGDPSLVVQPEAGKFVAFDAVCPHAGCTVAYHPSVKLFICPCHGSEFNGTTGAVEVGPATRGLTPIPVEDSDGELYVTS